MLRDPDRPADPATALTSRLQLRHSRTRTEGSIEASDGDESSVHQPLFKRPSVGIGSTPIQTTLGRDRGIGSLQGLVSDYEHDKLRPYADLIARFAVALEVSADELLGIRASKRKEPAAPASRRVLRRLQQVDKLPKRDQDALLRTIDAFLAARKAG